VRFVALTGWQRDKMHTNRSKERDSATRMQPISRTPADSGLLVVLTGDDHRGLAESAVQESGERARAMPSSIISSSGPQAATPG
jgi:hypothetical protein